MASERDRPGRGVRGLMVVAVLALTLAPAGSVPAQERSCVGAASPVVRRICGELVRAGHPDGLRQTSFLALELPARPLPQLRPAGAFRVTRRHTSFGEVPRIEIVDPAQLFVERDKRLHPVQVALAGEPAPFEACEVVVEFWRDGRAIDFDADFAPEEALRGEPLTFGLVYPIDRIDPPVLTGTTVHVRRFAPGPAELSIDVRVGGQVLESLSASVPSCPPQP
ncbi:MAG: hypothetical protein AAGH15_24640 [Myxococcota bacterium]